MNTNTMKSDNLILSKLKPLRRTSKQRLSICIPINRSVLIKQISDVRKREEEKGLPPINTFYNNTPIKKLHFKRFIPRPSTPCFSQNKTTRSSREDTLKNLGRTIMGFNIKTERKSIETNLKVMEDCQILKQYSKKKNDEKIKEIPHFNSNYTVKISKALIEYSYKEDVNYMYKMNMEDKGCSAINFRGRSNEAIFCLFDGHGGEETSEFLKNNILKYYKDSLKKNKQIESALTNTFKSIDNAVCDLPYSHVGSTGTVLHLIKEGFTRATIYSANIGDTRSYLFTPTSFKMLSHDHRCNNVLEANRIISSGGRIISDRVNGQLMLSRAFGDKEFKEYGVINSPYITKTQIDLIEPYQFLILACDGIWDVLSESKIKEIIKTNIFSTEKICSQIINAALANGTWDNLSVFVIKLT